MTLKEKHKNLMSPEWLDFMFPTMGTEIKETYGRLKDWKDKTKILPDTDKKIWKAFNKTSYKDLKVVVIGQDPYHNMKRDTPVATGLAFESGVEKFIPPSLKRILSEIESDCYSGEFDTDRLEIPDHKLWGERLSTQGVLLLNTALTVSAGLANSHKTVWKNFTRKLIQELDSAKPDLIWLLMGKDAQKFEELITNGDTVCTGHPSPLNTRKPFLGSKPFSKINKMLVDKNVEPIKW